MPIYAYLQQKLMIKEAMILKETKRDMRNFGQ